MAICPASGVAWSAVSVTLSELAGYLRPGAAFAGYPGDQSGPQRNLIAYWVRGAGAAKIRWGTDGAYDRCVRALGAKLPARYDTHGMCANLEKAATGHWPAEKIIPS